MQVMRLELAEEWMGHPEGSIVCVNSYAAQDMIKRGVGQLEKGQEIQTFLKQVKVKFLEEWMGNSKGVEITMSGEKAVELEGRKVVKILDKQGKALDTPVKDKMIHEPEQKKSEFVRE